MEGVINSGDRRSDKLPIPRHRAGGVNLLNTQNRKAWMKQGQREEFEIFKNFSGTFGKPILVIHNFTATIWNCSPKELWRIWSDILQT